MIKKAVLILCLILNILVINAQNRTNEVISEKYDRNSISNLFIERQQDGDIKKFYDSITISDKFDINYIPTKILNVAYEVQKPVEVDKIDAAVNELNLGKEIISYIFNRKEDGSFDDKIILERGRYNAKDQDILNSEATYVKDFSFEWGESLVNNSYIAIYDIYKIETSNNQYGYTSYKVEIKAHVFKLEACRETLDNFYTNAWADINSSEADKAKAREGYNKMRFKLNHVTTVNASGYSSDTQYSKGSTYDACISAYNNAITKFEDIIEAWKVKGAVISKKPLAAKIGKKEGVKNASRYQAYSYKEDKDGNLKSVKRGMVRATVISDNTGNSTGNTNPSLFYQISGFHNIEEGYILRQKNDIKLGVSIVFGTCTYGYRAGVDFDYITHIGKRGSITYAMLNVGYNGSLCDAMVGIGYGIPLTRFFEITPYAQIGGFYDIDSNNIYSYAAEPGLRLAITIQPLSIFAGAGIQICYGEEMEIGPNLKIGLKYTF